MARILVVDGDRSHREQLANLFTERGCTVAAVAHVADAVVTLRQDPIRLVVLKITARAGVATVTGIREETDAPIVVICATRDPATEIAALDSGADDFITLPYDIAVLLARLRAILRRHHSARRARHSALLRVGEATLDLARQTFMHAGKHVILSPTETRVMETLMRTPDVVVSRRALIRRVWNDDMEIADNRVDVFIRRLRRKIEAQPRMPAIIHTIRGTGYLFSSGDAPADEFPGVAHNHRGGSARAARRTEHER